ncbi:hypothetical protein [Croceibacterium ferulae]|uniref:hypothetical protein n=1 Tax=Croceibacterium ferulae TaxID=1854641 RepID=UPI000F874ADD|nr:hypothetical protein [Croceibacterium ferulae]
MKTLKTIVASLSLATLLVGHTAVAATRSVSSLPSSGVSAPASVDRVGGSLGEAEGLGETAGGAGLIIAIFGSIAAFLVFLEAVGAIDIIGGDDDDDSPG